eukprot:TRINITY_DN1183_c0_g5_i1.p1 TRINITY_DN1183_c0_g5~~TRINITY_DN1183_c0_g5_i1.p1  ORF type:complete len:491 (+),score=103.01 TRINITY_DN1183_c0_g5_i1:1008-2480(+)
MNRRKVEEILNPFMDDEAAFKETPGLLIYLVAWLDGYSLLLQRAGVTDNNWIVLESKIKRYLPDFLEYLQNLLQQWFENSLAQDRQYETNEYLEKLDAEDKPLVTGFPEDFFMCLNQQLDNIGGALKGEVYLEALKAWCTVIDDVQRGEKQSLLLNCDSSDSLKICLFINNYHKCIMHMKDTLPRFLKFGSQIHHERIDHLGTELIKAFNTSITDFLKFLAEVSFGEIESEVVPYLFTARWNSAELMSLAIMTLLDYLASYKRWLQNQMYFSQMVKLMFKRMDSLYFDQLLLIISKTHNSLQGFKPEVLSKEEEGDEKKKKKKKKKKEKQEIEALASVITRDNLAEGVMRDLKAAQDGCVKSFGETLGTHYTEKTEHKFKLFKDLLKNSRSEYDALLPKVEQVFKQTGIWILEAAMTVREDCDPNFCKSILMKYDELFVKKNNIRVLQMFFCDFAVISFIFKVSTSVLLLSIFLYLQVIQSISRLSLIHI